MKNKINSITKYWRIIFCYFLLVMALLMIVFVVIFKPRTINSNYLFDTSKKAKTRVINKRIVQNISPNNNGITAINIMFNDDSILKCNFHIKLYDENEKVYFDQDIVGYQSNILSLSLGYIPNSKDLRFKFEMELLNCDSINVESFASINKENSITGSADETLAVEVEYSKRNIDYYWYIIVLCIVSLVLIPFSRSDKNEK